MTTLEKRIAKVSEHQNQVLLIRNQMILQLEFCPAEAVDIVLGNIEKADRELRRLARVRRGIEKQIKAEN